MLSDWIGFQVDQEVRAILVRCAIGRKPQVLSLVRLVQEDVSSHTLALIGSQLSGDGAGRGKRPAEWVLVLNRENYQFSRVDRPDVPDAELEQSLRWFLSFKDVNPEEAAISCIPVPKVKDSGGREQVYVAACSQTLVDTMALRFASADLELGAVDVREMAQRNIASHIAKDRLICLLVADAVGIQMTVTLGSELYLDRFIRESVIDSDALDEACIGRITMEIRRSLDFVRNAYPGSPAAEIYLGPMPVDLDLASILIEGLGQPIRNLDLNSIFDWPPSSPLAQTKTQAAFFYGLGACLR